MEVLLREDYEGLGRAGELVTVKDGFARNYLIPKGLALCASSAAARMVDHERRSRDVREGKARREAEKLAGKLGKISLTAGVKTGEDDRLFGTVTPAEIATLLGEKGFDIDRKKIVLDEPITALGIYGVKVKLHAQVEAEVKLWVVKA
jgi:large subunit ribosomal protein L9